MKFLALIFTGLLGSVSPAFFIQNLPVSIQNAAFSGQIVDEETGKPIAAAVVSIFQNNKMQAKTQADASGFFKMDLLVAGFYEAEFAAAGYEKKRVIEVKIEFGKPTILNVSLKNGVILEEVSVVQFGSATANSARFSDDKMTGSESLRAVSASGASGLSGAAAGSAAPADAEKPSLSEVVVTGKRKTETRTETSSMKLAKADAPAAKSKMGTGEFKKSTAPKPAAPPAEFKLRPASAEFSHDLKMERAAPAKSVADDLEYAPPGEPAPGSKPSPTAGLLTAGEWNDLQNWGKHWADLLADGEIESFQKQWQFFPKNRFSFLLTNENDFPLIDATVKLFDETGLVVWETRTDNTGHAEAWGGLFDGKMGQKLTAQAIFRGKIHDLGKPKPFAESLNRHRFEHECTAPKNVDIVFAVDATGSMGDEIGYLQTELIDVLNRAKAANPSVNLRTGSVFYRDKTDEYIVRSSGLTTDLKKTVEYIQKQSADGGGDWPEAVHSALDEVVFHQNWSEEAVARICFFVLDASPHNEEAVKKSLQNAVRAAAAKGIRLVPVVASGIQKETEWLMKFMDLATNGSYVFLTDHSGIGGHHLEPTVEEYKVEALNNLLVRLITEFSTVENCEGKTEIRFQNNQNGQQNGQNQPENVLFWPNPASSQITFELPFDADVIQLFDAEGKSVKKIDRPRKGQFELSVADLPDGFYLLRILRGNEWQSGKLLVVRS